MPQLQALMKPPEQLTHAVQRICRHMHGGHLPLHQQALGSPTAPAAAGQHAANGDANGVQTIDSDSDDDIIIGNIVVSLKDPMSGARMSVPARFTDTAGTAPSAFDLDTYLDMVHRSKKWLDPHNQEPSTAQSLQVMICSVSRCCHVTPIAQGTISGFARDLLCSLSVDQAPLHRMKVHFYSDTCCILTPWRVYTASNGIVMVVNTSQAP